MVVKKMPGSWESGNAFNIVNPKIISSDGLNDSAGAMFALLRQALVVTSPVCFTGMHCQLAVLPYLKSFQCHHLSCPGMAT
jgi:hypothetical protein